MRGRRDIDHIADKRPQRVVGLILGLLTACAVPLQACGTTTTSMGGAGPSSTISPEASSTTTQRSGQTQVVLSTPAGVSTTPTRADQAMVTPTVTSPGPSPTPSLSELAERPLAELSADAQSFLESREGRWGVAVVVPRQGSLYVANADQLMSMASVVKVVIMLTTMDRATKEGRALTDREVALMRPMITASDNYATTVLWDELGGGSAVETYLRSIGILDIVPNAADSWGASRASAKAVATLFAKLAFGEIPDQANRGLAVALLSEVIPSQQWGVTAGVPGETPSGTIIGLKDGWYPAGYGWWVNSAGMLIPGDDRPAYTIAVLTRGQPTWEYGIATIEGVAKRVHTALHEASGSP